MKVSVRLFAVAKQIAASDLVTLELAENATLGDVRMELLDRFPALQPLAEHIRFSINANYAQDEEAVTEKDEVACIPPVSGG